IDINKALNLKWWSQVARQIEFWLVVLFVGLGALNLTIIEKAHSENLFSLALLMWLTLFSVLWDRREALTFKSNLFSSVFGAVLLVLILLRNIEGTNDFSMRLLPFVGTISTVLMASGIKSLKKYWREIVISGLLIYAKLVAVFLQSINLSMLTAKFSNAFLYIIGFEAYRDGVFVTLPQGRIQVLGACSGEESVILMLSVAFLFFFLVPISHVQKVISLTLAALIGFLINVVRITLLAIFVNAGDRQGFDYWHGEDGSLSFAIVSVCLFGAFCWFAYVRNLGKEPAPVKKVK
ncbi:MAG: cyanoexosortase A, partial [Synechocystis sp.]